MASATTSPMPSIASSSLKASVSLPLPASRMAADERVNSAVETGEQPGRRLADVADTEREDEAVERDLPPRGDRREQLGR